MLTFHPVTRCNIAALRKYYENCDYGLCEYSAGTNLMWRGAMHSNFAEACGCLLIYYVERNGRICFEYPVPGPSGDVDAALAAIEEYCREREISPILALVPESEAPKLLLRYPFLKMSSIRTWEDYLYRAEDLMNFAGRRYAGQRNHIKKFYKFCPDAYFRPLTADDTPKINAFWRDYEAEFAKGDNRGARNELALSRKMFQLVRLDWLLAGGMFDGDRLIALSMAERCGNTLIIHIEKALYSYPGVYPALVQAFAREFGAGCTLINREDDSGDPGLRASKLQYGPVRMGRKFNFEPENELAFHIEKLPELQTPRLALAEFTPEDAPLYEALLLHAPDAPADSDGRRFANAREVLTNRMLRFRRRQAAFFAVRRQGSLIGEASLARLDFRGGGEITWRLAPNTAGLGYEEEVLRALTDWALYEAGLRCVAVSCPSGQPRLAANLSSYMRKVRTEAPARGGQNKKEENFSPLRFERVV